MTGTLMSNDHKELHVLVDLVQPGLLGDSKSFKKHISIPMKLARTKDAKDDVLHLGRKRRDELDNILKEVYLKRNKVDVLKNSLTKKEETVIICALSDTQKKLYDRVLNLPDYLLLRLSTSPCDCGVNRNFFIGYKKMRTRKEQIEYQRRHKGDLILRKKCCYRAPLTQNSESSPNCIDPNAVLWRISHPNNKECERCPSCILLPALQKLYKICSHASLVQAAKNPDNFVFGTKEWEKYKNELDFAKVAINPTILSALPGKSYVREDSIMDDHLSLSGKMQALDNCLKLFYQNRDRALIFSYSTSTLDLIQHYVRAKGYSFLRLDGSTPTKKKQSMVDKFQESSDIFLFLISTKAGGLGLNLTAANKVIIYDVNWNPSHDSQAQDRAFRIGQLKNVDVIRLVARGTIEELMYARQIYKVHLTQETLEGTGSEKTSQPARIFRGVDKDPNRKGELFGSENLLKFKDGSFLSEMWKSSDNTSKRKSSSRHEEHSVLEVTNALSKMTKEQVENLGDDSTTKQKSPLKLDTSNDFEYPSNDKLISENAKSQSPKGKMSEIDMSCVINHNDFLRSDRGQALLRPGDDGFEEEMGGVSQMVHVSCAIECQKIESESEDSENHFPSIQKKRLPLKIQTPVPNDMNDSQYTANEKLSLKNLGCKSSVSHSSPKCSIRNNLTQSGVKKLSTIQEYITKEDQNGTSDESGASCNVKRENNFDLSLRSIYIPSYLRHKFEV